MIESDFPPFPHESIDWREKHKVSSVKNQEKCGGCWAFSSTGAVESAYAIKNNVLYNLTLSGKYHNRFRNQFLAIMFNCSNRSAKIEQLFIRMAT